MREVIVFATYHNQLKESNTIIASMINQTADNWRLVICSNGDESANEIDTKSHPNIEIRIEKENSGFWGCKNREKFIQEVANENAFLINTSVEDYYAPKLIECINMYSEHDFIFWDFSHHQFGYETKHANSTLKVGGIDWGNFAVKTDVIAKHGIPNTESYFADGETVVNMLNNSEYKIVKFENIFMMKN